MIRSFGDGRDRYFAQRYAPIKLPATVGYVTAGASP